MLSPTKKIILFFCIFCAVFSLVFFCANPAATVMRTVCLDVTRLPLAGASFLAHETRALLFFHRNYWLNMKLSRENEDLKSRVSRFENAVSENDRLRSLLDLKKRMGYAMTAALVIGKDFNTFRPYLIVEKGRGAGVRKSSPVLTPAGLVGKVFEVGRYSCKVILINDPDMAVPAMNARTHEQGLVSGTLDGRCRLRFLGMESDVREGDAIITSGLNMTYPPDIPIGYVKTVGVESSGIGKFAVLEPAVRLSSLQEVLVVTPANS